MKFDTSGELTKNVCFLWGYDISFESRWSLLICCLGNNRYLKRAASPPTASQASGSELANSLPRPVLSMLGWRWWRGAERVGAADVDVSRCRLICMQVAAAAARMGVIIEPWLSVWWVTVHRWSFKWGRREVRQGWLLLSSVLPAPPPLTDH